jgi:hypothetical protein
MGRPLYLKFAIGEARIHSFNASLMFWAILVYSIAVRTFNISLFITGKKKIPQKYQTNIKNVSLLHETWISLRVSTAA